MNSQVAMVTQNGENATVYSNVRSEKALLFPFLDFEAQGSNSDAQSLCGTLTVTIETNERLGDSVTFEVLK